MKTITATAQVRETGGTKAELKQLRRSGKVPAVLYKNGEAQHISLEYADVKPLLFTIDTYLIELAVDGADSEKTIVREAQYHPVTDRIQHVDFMVVPEDRAIEVALPVKFTGTPAGVIKGGKLMTKMRTVSVKGKVADMPDAVTVDVSHLDLGMSVKVNEVDAGGLQITSGLSSAVASVEVPRALRSAKSEDGEAEGGEAEGEATEEA